MMPKKILIVYAHPDDESFGNGGTVAKYAQDNRAECYLAVATRGEAGKMGDPPLTSRENLGYYREQELRAAGRIMGLKDIFFLDFIDGTLLDLTTDEQQQLTDRIASTILQLRPDIVITFPADGISKHKDHIAVHRMCLAAIESLRDQYIVPKLYFSVVPKRIYETRMLEDYGTDEASITTNIDIADFRKTKYEALIQHRTQVFSIKKVYPTLWEKSDWSVIAPYEYYQLVQIHGKPIDPSQYRESDLLDHL